MHRCLWKLHPKSPEVVQELLFHINAAQKSRRRTNLNRAIASCIFYKYCQAKKESSESPLHIMVLIRLPPTSESPQVSPLSSRSPTVSSLAWWGTLASGSPPVSPLAPGSPPVPPLVSGSPPVSPLASGSPPEAPFKSWSPPELLLAPPS